MSRTLARRGGRTRSRRTNGLYGREPLRLSTCPPLDYNVRPGERRSLVCPDCKTWRLVLGETDLRVQPHPWTDHGHGQADNTCSGSHRMVIVDIDVRAWQARLDRMFRDAQLAETRSAGRPVFRLEAHDQTATAAPSRAAHARYMAHRDACLECVGTDCAEAEGLALTYVRLLFHEQGRVDAAAGGRRTSAAKRPSDRAAQWQVVLPAVRAADEERTRLPQGAALSTQDEPDVPRESLHPVAPTTREPSQG